MSNPPASLDQETLAHRLEDVPDTILPHIRMGYRLLARAAPEQRRQFLASMLDAVEARRTIEIAKASEMLDLTDNVAGDALSAISLSMGAIIDLAVDEDDFVSVGQGRLFEADEAPIAREVVSAVISRREKLRKAMDTSSLANAVLPALRNLTYRIDVRLSFDDEGNVAQSVPVAVMYISTDCEPDLWCQANREDIRRLIEQLEKASKEIERAAALVIGSTR